jgi:hypothetical protein
MRTVSRVLPALLLALTLSACSGGAPSATGGASVASSGGPGVSPVTSAAPPSALGGQATATYDVTYTPGTVIVDAAAVAANPPTVSEDGATYTFANSNGISGLAPGNVMVLAGVALRKVTAINQAGGQVVVQTEPAALTDAISRGTIEAAGPVNWQAVTAGYSAGGGSPPVVTALDARGSEVASEALSKVALTSKGALSFTGKVADFDVIFALAPSADNMAFSLSATRANVKVTAKGTVSNFSQGTQLVYNPGSDSLVSTQAQGVQADGELTWSAFTALDPTLDEKVTSFQIPLTLPIPIQAGPIPLVLTIKAVVRIVPSLSAQKASSGGSFKISYRSDQGFDIKGLTASPLAQLYAANAEIGSTETVTAGFGPAGFGFGFEFPRMELGILGATGPYAFMTIYSYASGEWTPGTTLTSEIDACQKASLQLSAIGGYKLQVLGFSGLSDQKTLWQQAFDKYKDNKPCTLTGK